MHGLPHPRTGRVPHRVRRLAVFRLCRTVLVQPPSFYHRSVDAVASILTVLVLTYMDLRVTRQCLTTVVDSYDARCTYAPDAATRACL